MESPHKLAIAEAQVRAGRMSLLTLVRHARAEAPAGDAPLAAPLRPWAALTLACARAIRTVKSRRWCCLPTARGAQRAPPVGISQLPGTKTFGGARKPLQTALRAPWRPLRGAHLPFRRTGTRFRSFPDSSPPPPRASALGFRARLGDGSRILVRHARARLIRPATRARLAPRAPAKPRTTRRARVVEVAALASSRLRAGSLTRPPRAALRRSAEASGACIRQARIAFRFWAGAQGPGPMRERNRHEQPTHTS